jgi:beta-1,4-mannosyl-glycoprotein beta-1,4-N-acetylglucosaminyltransferase
MKIVDCFSFYNEIELLTYRLNLLNDVVDYFVLVESTHTHVGIKKPLFYEENKDRFSAFRDKIIHVVVTDFPHKYPNMNIQTRDQWTNEHYQRNSIDRGISQLSLADDDIIVVADLDEIPDPKTLQQIRSGEILVHINSLEMDMYYYNLNSRLRNTWNYAAILLFREYKRFYGNCTAIRHSHGRPIPRGGWHLSYFGDEYFIQNKLKMFGHQEYNHDVFTNPNNIRERVEKKGDLFDRDDHHLIDTSIAENPYLPPMCQTYLRGFILR